jgi:3-oxoacyl-[acyl-carrier-protein] synthase II
MHEVVITGVGVVSPIGSSTAAFAEALFAGTSGVGPVTRFDASRHRCRLAAEVDEEELGAAAGPYTHEIQRMDRFVRFALVASRHAVAAAGLFNGDGPPAGGGVFMGVGMGGLPHIEDGVLRQESRGPRKTLPYLIPSLIPNMAAGMVSLEVGFRGPQYTFTSACSSGSQALGEAMWALRSGRLDWALAGGTEAVITPITFSGFQAMRALSTRFEAGATPRPFDRRRDGMVVGEGAAIFVLEERRRAEERGAPVLGELMGYATLSGGGGLALRCSDTSARSMAAALADAELGAGEIDGLFAQAPGMVHDDRELAAIRQVFLDAGASPPVTSPEGHLGHTFGASGPLNLAAALAAFERQEMPPTLHLDEPEPGFEEIDLVRRRRSASLTTCLVNSFGFGGVNASLICRRPAARPNAVPPNPDAPTTPREPAAGGAGETP